MRSFRVVAYTTLKVRLEIVKVKNFYDFLQDVQEEEDVTVDSLGIVHENSVWGSEFSAGVRQYADEYGYQIVETISYASDICQIIDQEYYIVWPWNLATKELIWPMPPWEEREQAI